MKQGERGVKSRRHCKGETMCKKCEDTGWVCETHSEQPMKRGKQDKPSMNRRLPKVEVRQPELALAVSILDRAIEDMMVWARRPNGYTYGKVRTKPAANAAFGWMMSDVRSKIEKKYTFVDICDLIGANSGKLREGIISKVRREFTARSEGSG